jgi:hypothetical protein
MELSSGEEGDLHKLLLAKLDLAGSMLWAVVAGEVGRAGQSLRTDQLRVDETGEEGVLDGKEPQSSLSLVEESGLVE